MQEGDVALAALPQADGKIKPRPVVLLRRMPRPGDWLICGISSQLSREVAGFDELIRPEDADFANSSLAGVSLIRLSWLVLVSHHDIGGKLGVISSDRLQGLKKRLADYVVGELPGFNQPKGRDHDIP
jgi:mRNA interferase MazF